MRPMFDVPLNLSPSRVEAFLSCPMAFRFSSIERIPEPPAVHSTKGSLVHRALELLFARPASERTLAAARLATDAAIAEYRTDPDFTGLHLTDAAAEAFFADCWTLVECYFAMEDPTAVRDIGLELRLEGSVGELGMRGIIDRLDLTDDGGLVITDYKTGRTPGPQYAQAKMNGVHFYAFLCEQVLQQRPVAVRLMYLRSGETISARPTDQSIRMLTQRTTAVWKAISSACTSGSFQPKQGPLCNSCFYKAWCPAFGGDPSRAHAEAPLRIQARA